jgi:Sensors of blue-light using FAD
MVPAYGSRVAMGVVVKRVIYCSQADFDMSPDELTGLLTVARRHNTEAGLSGMLLYCGQSFLQLLEGESAAVDSTYARILADDRHRNIRQLSDAEVAAPMFPDWTMGFEHVDPETLALGLPGFTPATSYPLVNPELVRNGGVAQALLGLYAKNRIR